MSDENAPEWWTLADPEGNEPRPRPVARRQRVEGLSPAAAPWRIRGTGLGIAGESAHAPAILGTLEAWL